MKHLLEVIIILCLIALNVCVVLLLATSNLWHTDVFSAVFWSIIGVISFGSFTWFVYEIMLDTLD